MHFLNKQLSLDEISRRYRDFTSNVQFLLGENDEQMAAYFGYSLKEFKKVMDTNKYFSIANYEEFLKQINVSLESILRESVDYEAVLKQLKVDVKHFPQKYTIASSGKKRTVINILDYIEGLMGERYKVLLLRKFQLKSLHFENPDEKINNNFIVDLLDTMKERTFSDEMIIEMGEQSFYSNQESELGKILSSYKNPKSLIPGIFEEHINNFDNNFIYSINKLDNHYCLLDVKQNEHVAESLSKKQIGSSLLSIYKKGVMSTFTNYIGMDNSEVNLLKCAHVNDSYCRYEFKFPKPPSGLSLH